MGRAWVGLLMVSCADKAEANSFRCADSPLEGSGFELSVPERHNSLDAARSRLRTRQNLRPALLKSLTESSVPSLDGPVLRCAEPRSCETIRRRQQKDRLS